MKRNRISIYKLPGSLIFNEEVVKRLNVQISMKSCFIQKKFDIILTEGFLHLGTNSMQVD